MSICSRWQRLLALALVTSHLVLEANGLGLPDRSQQSFTFRARDPAPRASSAAATLELSAAGGLSEFPSASALVERGTTTLAHNPHESDESTSNTTTEANFTTALPGFRLSDYGVSEDDIHDPIMRNLTNVTHTWGDQKHNVMGLPSWAAVLVGGTAAAIIVIGTNMIGSRLSHPLPFLATKEQQLKDQIEQAKEKVRILEQAVKSKREHEKKVAEEEARKQRGEVVKEDPGPSYDELVGEMLYRTQEVQDQAVGAVNDSLKQAAPLLARAAYVQNVFSENMKLVQERASDMALREASNLYMKAREAVGIDEDASLDEAMGRTPSKLTGYDLPDWFVLDDDADLDPPPFALLLGGMFAPAQIKMTRANCQSQIVWNSIIVATCTACAIIDSHHTCPDKLVWAWQYGMLALNGIDILCCSFLASRCASAICVLQDDEDKIGRVPHTDNAVWDAFIMMQANSGQFFKAYFKYQSIIDSPIYTFQKIMCFISLTWGFLGIFVTCQDIVEDTLVCDAKVVLWFMHTYSFFFMLFLTWTVVGLIVWVLQKLSGLTSVTAPIMDSAKEADEEVPFKMPLFQTLARSFLLRDSSTMLKIRARQLDREVSNLETEVDETKRKLQQRQAYLEQLGRQKSKAAAIERKLVDEYKQKRLEQDPLPENTGGITSGTSAEGLAGESSSSPLFEGPSAAELFAQASSSVAAVQETGLTAYAQESGLMQSATDALSSVQGSASEAAARTQEQGGFTQMFTSSVETAPVGEAQESSSSTAERQPDTQPQSTEPAPTQLAPVGAAQESSSSTAVTQPDTQPQATESVPTQPEDLDLANI